MTKRILYLIAGLICTLAVKAHPDCFFTHYSSEDGLSQNTVMSILQDRSGNMWFLRGMASTDLTDIPSRRIKQDLTIRLP